MSGCNGCSNNKTEDLFPETLDTIYYADGQQFVALWADVPLHGTNKVVTILQCVDDDTIIAVEDDEFRACFSDYDEDDDEGIQYGLEIN